jgi:hypothetical protein
MGAEMIISSIVVLVTFMFAVGIVWLCAPGEQLEEVPMARMAANADEGTPPGR